MQLKNAMCIEDLRRMARRNVPGVFIEYMEAGSYSEHTRDANVDDMRAIKLRQRVLVDVSQRNLKTTVLGEELALPLALAPTGLAGMQYADGEILACRAAHKAGIQFRQSTMSICSVEDVAEAVGRPFWFQLYVMRDRGFVKALVERAAAAKCSALFLTVDLPVNGQRHCDQRNGLSVPPRITARTVFDVAIRPRWAWRILNGKRKTFANIDGHLPGFGGITLAEWTQSQFDPTVSWKDVEWIRSIWNGKLVLKGILDPRMRARRSRPAPTAWWCRTMAGASSTARPRPSRRCPRSPTRSAGRRRSCSIPAYAPGRTSSARSRSAPMPA